jgi:hypothetical protein
MAVKARNSPKLPHIGPPYVAKEREMGRFGPYVENSLMNHESAQNECFAFPGGGGEWKVGSWRLSVSMRNDGGTTAADQSSSGGMP